jgi:hypothetical protein
MGTDLDANFQRANQVADTIRTHLVAFNTGGIATALATAASLVEKCVRPAWASAPTALFAGGLVVVMISLFLQKHKAIKRARADQAGKPEPNYDGFFWRNFTYDALSLLLFCAGVGSALHALYVLTPGCPAHG